MAANFAFRTGSKKRKLFAYHRNLVSLLQSNMLSCVIIFQKGSVKTTKYGVFACSDHMHVLYVEIKLTRIPFQIDFKLVSIVECLKRGRV